MFLFLLALIPIVMEVMTVSVKESTHELHSSAQAENVALAGINGAVGWFRRQNSQVVTAFDPSTGLDSEDGSLGIIKTYDIKEGGASNLKARYEVRRTEVKDVSEFRLIPPAGQPATFGRGSGAVWSIRSIGYIYRGATFTPGAVLSRAQATCEIRSLAMNYAPAAITLLDFASLSIGNKTQIYGEEGLAVAYSRRSNVTDPVIPPTSELTGSPLYGALANPGNATLTADDLLRTVFAVSGYSDLCSIADFRVADASGLPAEYPEKSLVCIDGNGVFSSASRPFQGSGILIVNGNLELRSAAKPVFSGLIFVRGGSLIVEGPALLSGQVVAAGAANVNTTSSGDFAQIVYSPTVLDMMRNEVLRYRPSQSTLLGANNAGF